MDDRRGACCLRAVHAAEGIDAGDRALQSRDSAAQIEFQHQDMGGLDGRARGLVFPDGDSDGFGRGLAGPLQTVAESCAAGVFPPQGR